MSRFGEGDESTERVGDDRRAGGRVDQVDPSERQRQRGWSCSAACSKPSSTSTGDTVFTTTFTAPVEEPRDRTGLDVPAGRRRHRPITRSIELESGEQIADLTGLTVTGVSADGCTVVGTRAGASEVVGDGGSVPLGRVRSAALAPDGKAVVVQTTTGATQLIADRRRLDAGTRRST